MSTTLRRLPLGHAPDHNDTGEWMERDTWRYQRHHMIVRRIVVVGAALAVVAVILGLLVLRANGHYQQGRRELAAGRYEVAATEFAAANVLSIGYRDAGMLQGVAVRQAAAAEAAVPLAPSFWPHQYRMLLSRSLRALRDGEYQAAAIALRQLRRDYAGYPIDLGRHGARAAMVGGEALLAAARQRLGEQEWSAVRDAAASALVLQPGWRAALDLSATADLYARVSPLFDRARSAAGDGQWARANRLVRSVIAMAPGFPGAAALLATTRAKLAAAAQSKASNQSATPAPTTSRTPAPRSSPTPRSTLPPPP